jgi:UDP-N-acetylglucosamine acyltransferase
MPRPIACSGVTDCYQPLERRLRITRACLEVLRDFRNPVTVITKNHLVTRDADILADLAAGRMVIIMDDEQRENEGDLLMAASHVAHDCRIGDHVIIANGTLLGGHVRVSSRASLSGVVAVHHWATIGGYSFVAGLSRVLHDVPPFMLCEGSPARPRCINVVALKRGGFSQPWIEAISEAYRLLYRAKVGVEQAREILRSQGMLPPPVLELLEFLDLQQQGRHGRARERRRAA